MFSPTELLRLYLKEAFSLQGVAASDDRVRTWTDHRRHLGRDVLGVLRSVNGGRFTLQEDRKTIVDERADALVRWHDDFDQFFRQYTVERYQQHLEILATAQDPALNEIPGILRERTATELTWDRLFSLLELHPSIQAQSSRLSTQVEGHFRGLIRSFVDPSGRFLDELAIFVASLKTEQRADEEETDDAEPETDEPRRATLSDPRQAAIRALRDAFYSKARSLRSGNALSSSSRPRAIWEWLGARAPAEAMLVPLGTDLQFLRAVNFLRATHLNLVRGVVGAYQRFRRLRHKEGRHYAPDAHDALERAVLGGHELDLVLLVMLRHAGRLLEAARRSRIDLSRYAVLAVVRGEYVTQVVVDEATDFSPLQLACMLELTEPAFRSMFVCGDVRQRITNWGIRSIEQLRWVAADFEMREIGVGYRQSRRLADLAKDIALIGGGPVPEIRHVDETETADVKLWLGEGLAGPLLARWLADRTMRIEMELGSVPSIAIFVDGEELIDQLVRELQPLLAERNLAATACKGGVVGQEDRIRVFDVQHIKGLEFEAVFFVGIDQLAARVPDLFDKFLYVGITRAATYLGLTCETKLPAVLEPLRDRFTSD